MFSLQLEALYAPIECELKTIDLDDEENPTCYEALSYVWGKQSDVSNPSKILLHGHEHTVTPNLEAALRHVRDDDRPLLLWVDAICINQGDLSERASQVEMMADIYKRAVTTVSWLGEGDADSDEAVELVRELGNFMTEHRQELDDYIEDEDDTVTPVQVFESLGFSLEHRNWSSVWRLFDRPYWSRVWIIQELAARGDFLMGANGVFHCGDKSFWRFQFDGFCTVVLLIIFAGPRASLRPMAGSGATDATVGQDTMVELAEPTASLSKGMHPPGLRMAQVLTALRGMKHNSQRHMDWLLRLTRRFQATDPRDKLYAIRGLVADGEIVTPDYTKPFEQVVRDYALKPIQAHSSLNVLLGNRFMEQPFFTPSWVPDILAEDRRTAIGLAPSSTTPYHAAGDTDPIITHDNMSDVLSCRAALVGTINKVIGLLMAGEGPGFDNPMSNYVSLGQDQVFNALRQFYRALGDDRSREIFWRTLCIDADTSDTFGSESMTPAPAEYGAQFRVMFNLQGGTDAIPENFLPGEDAVQRYRSFIAPFSKGLEAALINRSFITTRNGQVHRMGIGPYLAKEGDIVVVLFGANLCVVLRPVQGEDRYKVLGHSYIQGIMKGELVKDVPEDGGQVFHIV
ncbi:heterokaryon incompatibility protein-domain-containing protein [Rhypophila decipiens]|uniref:Heterokaryon incompatibility protein-domain-containing protein n=1 Tax=Rhypophila decipiens TaxID=261697 RepID=A0AAN6YBY0_9PEZI|nr:heterokaryon incompatibility protein-domain-containing protein [Rhypophila decipiens]